jgi:hypothetical protein
MDRRDKSQALETDVGHGHSPYEIAQQYPQGIDDVRAGLQSGSNRDVERFSTTTRTA